MKDDKKNKMIAIFKRKIRCNMCHQIPIIKEILLNKGINCFITSECLNRHGVFLCPIQDFASNKTQLDQIKCCKCNQQQTLVDSTSKLFYSCQECNKFFCSKCYHSHLQQFQKTHHVLRIDEFDNTCNKHNGPFTHFCGKCKANLCPLCYQSEHYNHDGVVELKNVKLSDKEYTEITIKVEVQKAQIDIIDINLDKFIKFVNDKVEEYKKNLEMALKFNRRILNAYVPNKLNYQSIINIKKVIDIDISDIDFIKEIQNELNKIIDLIKSKSTIKGLSANKTQKTSLDAEIIKTVEDTLVNNLDEASADNYVDKEEEKDQFLDNELLKKIAKKNKKVLSKEDIFGVIKKIYVINELDAYLLIIDNGIFFYDLDSNEIINYIDINEGFEYNEINSSAYYYNNENKNMIYLFIGTTSNKIKIFLIDENEDFKYKLIQEIMFSNINGICTSQNGKLLVLEDKNISLYNINNDNKYEKERELENGENTDVKKMYDTLNYIIVAKKEGKEIVFYDKKNLEKLFSIKDINNDDNTKMFELSKNLVCVSYKNTINVIDTEAKKVSFYYENKNDKINYIQCYEVINKKNILVSYNLSKEDDKSILYTLEWNDKELKEKEAIEDLNCKMISKANNNKAIIYCKYGINAIELKN
jgi:hypothetical protein